MKTTEETPECDLFFDVFNAGKGRIRRWRVIDGQQRAGNHLHEKQPEQGGAEDVRPADAFGLLFREKIVHEIDKRIGLFEAHAFFSPSVIHTLPSSISLGYCRNDFGGGPAMTSPSLLYFPPWHGQ
ncbi:MAG: hypothetical protein MAGBODY4_01528 [Candidatus Marinimicrobia bacterium]|nr:hypothetical protein [Candidatus Neomarinimicrobiota bacterium]